MKLDRTNRYGYGLLFPLRREHNDFSAGTGTPLLRSAVRKVLGTKAAGFGGRSAGTYPWRLNFGSFIHLLRHSNFRGIEGDLGIVYCSEALRTWEQRVDAVPERTEMKRDDRAMRIRVYWLPVDPSGTDVRVGSEQPPHNEVVV